MSPSLSLPSPTRIAPRFFDAVRGSALSADERQPFLASGREYWYSGPMRDGAMGCSLSHFGVWQTMIDEGIEAAVVLEDDAVPTSDGHGILADSLNALHGRRDRLDLVLLHKRSIRPLVRITGGNDGEPGLAILRYNDFGAESYFITARCAEYLLSKPERYLFEVDLFLQHWWRHDPHIDILHLEPALFQEEGRPSLIGYEDSPRYESSNLRHRIARQMNRWTDSLEKRIRFRGYASRARRRLAGG